MWQHTCLVPQKTPSPMLSTYTQNPIWMTKLHSRQCPIGIVLSLTLTKLDFKSCIAKLPKGDIGATLPSLNDTTTHPKPSETSKHVLPIWRLISRGLFKLTSYPNFDFKQQERMNWSNTHKDFSALDFASTGTTKMPCIFSEPKRATSVAEVG